MERINKIQAALLKESDRIEAKRQVVAKKEGMLRKRQKLEKQSVEIYKNQHTLNCNYCAEYTSNLTVNPCTPLINCSAPHTSFALLNRLWAQYSRQTVQVRDFSILSSEFVKSSECLDGRKLVELQPIH